MGNWFANLNIRKSSSATIDAVSEQLTKWLREQQFEPAASAEDADGAVVLLTAEDSEWITVCTELVHLEEPEKFGMVATAVSEALHGDVLGIACFDSDYLWLNLINAREQTDGWLGIGSGKELGFTRRNKLSPWKKKVHDYACFTQYVKEHYILADAFLADAAQCLGLPVRMSGASVRYLEDIDPEKKAVYLYFRQAEGAENRNLVQMAHYEESRPALMGWERDVRAINMGAESKGLTIWFLAPGVEENEVTFSDVCIVRQQVPMPIVLTRAQKPDGRWAWCWHDPEFPIPAAVTGRMKREKRWELEQQRSIAVRFTPQGDSRKALDIQIGFVPDGNPDGCTWWSVWRKYGSKEDFIKWHNKTWKMVRSMAEADEDVEKTCLPILKRADFDRNLRRYKQRKALSTQVAVVVEWGKGSDTMITNEDIWKIALQQSAYDMGCAPEDFRKAESVVNISKQHPRARKYLKLPLGSAMLEEALNQIGEGTVFLWAFKENKRARRFYEKHGFRWDGTERVSEFDGAMEVRYVRAGI